MEKEKLIKLKEELSKLSNSSDEQRKSIFRQLSDEEKESLTGLASIDKPWMKQYEYYDETKDSIYINNKTVWEVAEVLLEKYSNVNYIEYFGKNISRETFASYVEMWARAFRAVGIEKGDLIPIYTPATPEAFAMFFAANAIGAIPYYQKIAITKEALEAETKGAKYAVVFDSLWPNVKDVFGEDRFKNVFVISAADSMMFPLKQMAKLKSFIEESKNKNGIPKTNKYISTNKAKSIAKYYTGEYKVPFEKDRITAITTSSGTTSSVVKGIMDTNEGILASLQCTINAETGYTEGKRTLTCFPPTASTSINCLQLLPTFTGGTIIFDPRVDMAIWYDQVMKYMPDITISTGPLWERYVQDLLKKEKETGKVQNLSWQDYFIMGGAGTTHNILNYLNTVVRERGAKRDFTVGYGFSEVFGVLSVDKYDGNYKEANNNKQVISVGIPLPGYTVGIFDEKGQELPYGTGVRGELWIKAPSNMDGYFNKPEATSNTIIDGWIHSGDLCEIDNDGNIFFYGRLKNNITINNKKTYLFDVANDIRDHFGLHDIIVEKKKLEDGNISLNMYFVQEPEKTIDSKELILNIDQYLSEKNITMDGYKEFENSLPIDPTTLKPKSRDTEGFIKYIDDEKYDVSYTETVNDVYQKNTTLHKKENVKRYTI